MRNLDENEPKLLYICCPYSHPAPAVREYRYQKSCIAASKLMKAGIVVFNPLSHSVPINEFLSEVDSHEFWMSMDLPILRRCDEVLIIGLEDWTKSNGVKTEMFEAIAHGIPVTQIEEADIELLPKIPKSARRFLKSEIFTEEYDA